MKKIILLLCLCGSTMISVAFILLSITPKYYQISYDIKNTNKKIDGIIDSKVIYEINSEKVVASYVESQIYFDDVKNVKEFYRKLDSIFSKQNATNISYSMFSNKKEIKVIETIENYSELPSGLNSYFHELNGMLKYDKKISSNDILNMLKEKNISYEKVENPRNSIKIVSGSGVPI